jgi:FKBP-type peptidyl-prolyl cis-trans isomerase 2
MLREVTMYKLSYTVKDKNGYLVDKSKKFEIIQQAFLFIREQKVNNITKLVGKPILERI